MKIKNKTAIVKALTLTVCLCNLFAVSAEVSPWEHEDQEIDSNAPLIVPGVTPITYFGTFERERETYGYNPRFLPNTVTFDNDNRPYMIVGLHGGAGENFCPYPQRAWVEDAYIQTLESEGGWVAYSISQIIKSVLPSWSGKLYSGVFLPDERIVFDSDGDAYFAVNPDTLSGTFLFHSSDGMQTWDHYKIGYGSVRLEFSEASNDRSGPPVIVTDNGDGIGITAPVKNPDGSLTVPPITWIISDPDYILSPSHSGLGNSTITLGDKVHIVATYTGVSQVAGGTDQYYFRYDKKTGAATGPKLLGTTLSCCEDGDGHNGPAITADSSGGLHVVLGSHQRPFKYTFSLDGGLSWSEPEPFNNNETVHETYVGLVADSSDTLHLVSRMVDSQDRYCLHYMRKKANESSWKDLGKLVVPHHRGYSVYYHKLTIDRQDRLYLAYFYYAHNLSETEKEQYRTKWPDEPDPDEVIYAHDPVVITSDDGGDSWSIAATRSFSQLEQGDIEEVKLAAYYSFDDAQNLHTDDSSNGSDLQLNQGSPASAAAGRVNGGVYFDGVDDLYDIKLSDTEPAIYPDGEFSVSTWVKPDAAVSDMALSRPASSTGGFSIVSSGSPASWRVTLYRDFNQLDSGAVLTAEKWTHIAYTFSPDGPAADGIYTGRGSIYIDGVLANTAVMRYQQGGYRFGLGGRADNSAFYTGAVDEFAVFATALTGSEVYSLASGETAPDRLWRIPLYGDINDDGAVDHHDLAILASTWLNYK
ncbi:hypothetical protein SMSP2_01418 [Limihaloglobus sulfuriphilus]|uniref:LamG-like jellyroll fold domain-containing protein n=1 Tax=Limihaloglobus sulfuriphilus TaxID=1851148 RepID=A0A1Q2MEH5_9BACT|nr:LamG-like jellyroll fold domain-containing protein [Limihaloglobus sulfuriphilus]AQQ71054.1 hypothetical protein SMSP2_01418 [Limihaloglobus sulfuriphilus]